MSSCCGKGQKIFFRQGDDVRIFVECVDDDNNPINISSAQSIRWYAARSVNSSAVITKTLLTGITINNPTSFYFDISSSESELLTGNYYHEAEIINESGLVYTPLFGQMIVPKTLIKPV